MGDTAAFDCCAAEVGRDDEEEVALAGSRAPDEGAELEGNEASVGEVVVEAVKRLDESLIGDVVVLFSEDESFVFFFLRKPREGMCRRKMDWCSCAEGSCTRID